METGTPGRRASSPPRPCIATIARLARPSSSGSGIVTAPDASALSSHQDQLALSLLVLLLVQSLPMFRGPRWLKSGFARVARSIKKVPSWQWTSLGDSGLFLGTVPTLDTLNLDGGLLDGCSAGFFQLV